MRRFIASVVLLLIVPVLPAQAAPRTLYVATDGADGASGSADDPFRTIQRCAVVAQPGDTCVVASGTYRETVRPSNSGTADAPIVFRAAPGARVSISGADVVTGWTSSGGRFTAPVGWDLGPGFNQVFFDGVALFEARFPNPGSGILDGMQGEVEDPSGSGASWNFAAPGVPAGLAGTRINFLTGPEWVTETGTVTSTDGGRVAFSAPGGQLEESPDFEPDLFSLRDGNPWFVWGSLDLLDAANEFFHGGSAVWIERDPAGHTVEVKRRQLAFDLADRSHITIQDIDVVGATIAAGRPGDPTDNGSTQVVIDGVDVRYPSHFTDIEPGDAWAAGVDDTGVLLFGERHVFRNGSVTDSAGNGISLAGTGHLVEGSVIQRVNGAVSDTAAVMTGWYGYSSSGHVIRENVMSHAARSILVHRNTQRLSILWNDLSESGLVASDLGLTYTYDTDGDGSVIAYNRVHGNRAEGNAVGIYLDNGSNGFTVHHNVVWEAPIALQMNFPSTNNLVANNTLVAADRGLQMWGPDRDPGTIDVTGTRVVDNIILGEIWINAFPYDPPLDIDLALEGTIDVDPGFVAPGSGNFGLRSGSKAIDTGRTIPGVTVWYSGAGPDVGAVEHTASGTRFEDVAPSDIFLEDIEWLAGRGITVGCNGPSNDRFCPDATVTRGQMAAFMVRALGLTDRGSKDFVDDDASVFQADIERLATAGITTGCSADRFCPDDPVTRAQMAAFLVRALRLPDLGSVEFVDDDVSVFENDIERLAAKGITRGCNPPAGDRFCPDSPVTRQEMAAFLRRALG